MAATVSPYDRYQNPAKVYVDVFARFSRNGELIPISFVWEDGTEYTIDKILDIRQAASLKAGGAGIRYTFQIRGRQACMYLEENRWFMERKNA